MKPCKARRLLALQAAWEIEDLAILLGQLAAGEDERPALQHIRGRIRELAVCVSSSLADSIDKPAAIRQRVFPVHRLG